MPDTDVTPSGASRRAFLGAAGLTGVAAGVWGGFATDADAADPTDPTATADDGFTYSLELEGLPAGGPSIARGGTAVGVVVVDSTSASTQRKHIGNVKYNDFHVQCATGMSQSFYDWLSAFTQGSALIHNGQVTTRTADGTIGEIIQFGNAMIDEIVFPGCDGASKDAAKMSIKVKPEYTRMGQKPGPDQGVSNQKLWSPANFRLQIDGVDASQVSKVDQFSITQLYSDPDATGSTAVKPIGLDFSDFVIETPLAGADALISWYQTVLQGKTDRRSALLTVLTPNQKNAICTVKLGGLQAYKMTLASVDPDKHRPPTLRVTMCCEQMGFSIGQGIAVG